MVLLIVKAVLMENAVSVLRLELLETMALLLITREQCIQCIEK